MVSLYTRLVVKTSLVLICALFSFASRAPTDGEKIVAKGYDKAEQEVKKIVEKVKESKENK